MIQKSDKGYCVFKKGMDDAPSGKSLGCHPSRKAAQRQVKALYANVDDVKELAKMPPVHDVMTVEIEGERVAISELIEAWHELQEAKKTVDGKSYSSSDFLVVEDEGKPTTWHLQVKKNGKPDRRLMGAAKAALTSPGGHRGEKYSGPNKAQAIKKLKSLYKSEDMDFGESDIAENGDYADYSQPMALSGATTFADLMAQEQAQDAASKVGRMTWQFQTLVSNVMADQDIEDKVAGIKTLADEFVSLVRETMGAGATESPAEESAAECDVPMVEFAESSSGIIDIAEDNTQATSDKRAPLKLNVQLIKPGWGNKKDSHFYPSDVLRRDAKIFEGAKMHVSDHRASEKSERTEVSVIEQIVGWTSDGAPIARVAVFDPEFAEKTRNRASLGQLSTLECSILASGKARKGKAPDGIEGNIVEAITSAHSVDWVTKAGAGGQAISLAESDSGNPELQPEGQGVNAGPQASEGNPEPVSDATVSDNAPEPVAPSDNHSVDESAQQSTPDLQESHETFMSESEVDGILKTTRLPQLARDRLAGEQYRNTDELNKVIAAEVAYIKAITGSGKPFANGMSQNIDQTPSAEEREQRGRERFNRIMREVGAMEV